MTNEFKAYKAADDTEFTAANSIETYYQTILSGALRTFVPKSSMSDPVTKTEDAEFKAELEKFWGAGATNDSHLLGYINIKEPGLGNLKAILFKIAEEERKYYYKWEESGNPVQKENGENVLNQLQRMTIVNCYRIFFPKKLSNDYISQYDGILEPQLEYQDIDEAGNILPIAISFSSNFSIADQNYYGVYFNSSAIPLYQDQNEETNAYRYEKNGAVYSPIITSRITTPFDPTKMNFLNVTKEDKVWLEYVPKYRFFLSLFNERKNRKVLSTVTQGMLTPIETEDEYKTYLNQRLSHFTVNAEAVATNCGITKDDASWQKAVNASHRIFNNYYCFYYKDGDVLKNLLSEINIGGGGSSGGNYAMRADKVNEVDYQWQFHGVTSGADDEALAKLLKAYIGLKDGCVLATSGPPVDFNPTNWARDTTSFDLADKVSGMSSWFNYYKKFKSGVPRRNNPPSPSKPRVADLSDKTGFKLTNNSYRVWKKGQRDGYEGEVYGGGSANTRLDAATVMAEALNHFSTIYDGMKGQGQKTVYNISLAQITDTKLPASAFAYYLVHNDTEVKDQWKKDNEDGSATLRTNQEWCHLLGHGDGGPEELGNFVSGSKHCNTEQLAIEIGQRRITHNTDILQIDRNKLRAKITAYLMPNEGAWAEGKEIAKRDLRGYETLTKADTTRWIDAFFDGHDTDPNKYKLKAIVVVKTSFEALSIAVRQAGTTDDKKKLFEFRRYLESNFFLYLPLARWMRYKIYYDKRKIFDHIYDAQSQSFDYHEAQILDFTVERVIYYAMGLQNQYKQKILERVAGLIDKYKSEKVSDEPSAKRSKDLKSDLIDTYDNLK